MLHYVTWRVVLYNSIVARVVRCVSYFSMWNTFTFARK